MLCILGNIGICFLSMAIANQGGPTFLILAEIPLDWGGTTALKIYPVADRSHPLGPCCIFFLMMPYTQKQDTRMQTWMVQQQFCMHGHVKQQSNESSNGSSANSTRGSIQCLQSPSSYSAQGSMMAAFTPRQPSVGTGGGHVNL